MRFLTEIQFSSERNLLRREALKLDARGATHVFVALKEGSVQSDATARLMVGVVAARGVRV